MRRIFAFLAITADGRHQGPNGELDWHNAPTTAGSGYPDASGFPNLDDEESDEVDTLMFGRVTYELMASYWPTPEAQEADPQIAARMNHLPKIVVSRTLTSVSWPGTRLLGHDVVTQLRTLKEAPGKDIAIFGSSTLTASLLHDELIDELRFLVNPIVIGAGISALATLTARVPLQLTGTRTFPAGNVLLSYRRAT